MTIADIIVVVLIGALALIGMSRGLLLSVFHLAAYFIAVFVAAKLSPVLTNILKDTSVFQTIHAKIVEFVDGIINSSTQISTSDFNSQIDAVMNEMALSSKMQENLNIQALRDQVTTTSNLIDTLGDRIAQMILLAISFMIIYFVARIILFFVSDIIKKTASLPVIRQFDKVGGLAFGVIEGVLVVWVVCTVLFLFRANDIFAPVFESMMNGKIAIYLYEHNLLLNILSGVLDKLNF